MPIKVTLVFSQSTNKGGTTVNAVRVGGWSESYYWPDEVMANALVAGRTLANFRCGMLTSAGFITGIRFQQVAPLGPSQSLQVNIPGQFNIQADLPQMALQLNVPGVGVRNIARLKIRGIPDGRVVEGEFQTTQNFTQGINDFVSYLNGFRFRGRDLTKSAFPLISVGADGTFFAEDDTNLTAGMMVRVMRTRFADGTFRGGRFQIASMTGLRSGVLRNWIGVAVIGGKIRQDANGFFQYRVSEFTIGRISTKKVGRPSTGFVGRR